MRNSFALPGDWVRSAQSTRRVVASTLYRQLVFDVSFKGYGLFLMVAGTEKRARAKMRSGLWIADVEDLTGKIVKQSKLPSYSLSEVD